MGRVPRSSAGLRARTVNWNRSIGVKRQRGGMANSMNKSAAVITGTGANSIIRGAKTVLSGHYSGEPSHVKICVQTGAPLHLIYSESRGSEQGGKRVIAVKIASRVWLQELGGPVQVPWGSGMPLGVRPDRNRRGRPPRRLLRRLNRRRPVRFANPLK